MHQRRLNIIEKKALQALVGDFLEKGLSDLEEEIDRDPQGALHLWESMEWLFTRKFPTHPDHQEEGDRRPSQVRRMLVAYHHFLRPIWEQFRQHLLSFLMEVIPGRREAVARRNVMRHGQPPATVTILDRLERYARDPVKSEQLYEISLQAPPEYDGIPSHLKTAMVSFEEGVVRIFDYVNVVENFLEVLQSVPLSTFGFCGECGKCFVRVRSSKQYCSTLCAAKAIQKRRWREEREKYRLKEKQRYQEKRKKSN